jgi:LysR family transcriptional regulator, transcriptional activator of nhaA
LIVCHLLRPIARLAAPVHLVCREDSVEQLVSELALHRLDLVIADSPTPPHLRVKVFNHLLGESDTAFFAPSALAARLRRRFPESLQEVPMVLPSLDTAVRRGLNAWFDATGLRPQVVAEFEDTALMKTFAHDTGAVFPAPVVIAKDIGRIYGVRAIGMTDAVREHYYAISAERRLKHPGVLAITAAAREELFK